MAHILKIRNVLSRKKKKKEENINECFQERRVQTRMYRWNLVTDTKTALRSLKEISFD